MDDKSLQEEACGRVFTDWLQSRRAVKYKLRRASEVFGQEGRWDFVVEPDRPNGWIAVEVKGLVLSESRRQFGDWSSFLSHVSKRMQGKVEGSYFVLAAQPWTFRQQETGSLVEAFVGALAEIDPNLEPGKTANVGPTIAARVPQWPTKHPTIDKDVMRVVHPPEDLWVSKHSDSGSLVELGASVGQAYDVDPTLLNTLASLLGRDEQGSVKANVQLGAAKERGASETVLLLDSHIHWKPKLVAQALKCVDQSLLSNIDRAYLVGTGQNRVSEVWQSNPSV